MKKDIKDVKSNAVTDRRALLKGLIAGSAVVTGSKALPETWVKPITDAVVLPGHALPRMVITRLVILLVGEILNTHQIMVLMVVITSRAVRATTLLLEILLKPVPAAIMIPSRLTTNLPMVILRVTTTFLSIDNYLIFIPIFKGCLGSLFLLHQIQLHIFLK